MKVRAISWWPSGRDGTNTKEHHGNKIRRPLQVKDGGDKTTQWEKRVMDAVEDYLENCAEVKVDIDVVQSLLKPEKLEVSRKYGLKRSTRRGSIIFQLFDTSEKPNHVVASRRRWLESQGEKRCTARE